MMLMRMTYSLSIVVIAIPLLLMGCHNDNRDNENDSIFITYNEYEETDVLFNYKYGVTEDAKRKMFLSEIARHYSMETTYQIDSITPIIDISYEDTFRYFEVFRIGRTDPWVLEVQEITDIELLGRYIVTYALPNERKKTIHEIRDWGITTDCPYLSVHESAWFIFISFDTRQYYIVKNLFSKEESIAQLQKIINPDAGLETGTGHNGKE